MLTRSPNTVSVGAQSQPFGQYDVRVEGEGFVTETKRGVQLASTQPWSSSFDRATEPTSSSSPKEGSRGRKSPSG